MGTGPGTGIGRQGRRFRTAMRAVWYAGLAAMAGAFHLALLGVDMWPVAVGTTCITGAAIASWLASRRRCSRRRIGADGEGGLGRCGLLSRRVDALLASLPCMTEAETLAVLHEIRNCYAEALEQAGRLGDGGGGGGGRCGLAARLRRNLAQIDGLYDIQTGSLRCTPANAADFAEAMRGLGREYDDIR